MTVGIGTWESKVIVVGRIGSSWSPATSRSWSAPAIRICQAVALDSAAHPRCFEALTRPASLPRLGAK
jgi:hypothetical protein